MTLTARQYDTLVLASRGMTAHEISQTLGLSESTVKEHLALARVRLAARSTAEAVAVAYQRGVLA